jgi:hypothetical protein
MQLRDIFIKHDKRREKWRLQPMGCVAAGLAAILVASLTSGVWRTLAGPRLQVTPTAQPTAVLAEPPNPEPRPTATSIVREACPQDPALWTLVPYSLPGVKNTTLYMVDPPCVMAQVERAFAACVDLRASRGRQWTEEDEERCYSTAGFTTLLGGEEIPALAPGWPAYGQCVETEKADGTPVTSADLHVVFYTISEDKRVADVLVVNDAHPTVRIYDCETGELIEETAGDPAQVAVAYYPLLYEDGRWRMGYRHDVGRLVTSDRAQPAGLIDLVRSAQGR